MRLRRTGLSIHSNQYALNDTLPLFSQQSAGLEFRGYRLVINIIRFGYSITNLAKKTPIERFSIQTLNQDGRAECWAERFLRRIGLL